MPELAQWDSFYVIVGSAAGALIGLQFVVMTLIAQLPSRRIAEGSAAFGTPTVVYFSVTLLLSAVLRVPWPGFAAVAVVSFVIGLCGVGYSAIVLGRMRRQTAYRPDAEDWFYFAALPFAGYLLLAGSAAAIFFRMDLALFGIGAAALILLFTGIHNAWDTVTYHVFSHRDSTEDD